MTADHSLEKSQPFDRERERIAVRYSERQRRFRYGGEPAAKEPDVDAVFIPFAEVIGWIAYRRFSALDGDAPGTAEFFSAVETQDDCWWQPY